MEIHREIKVGELALSELLSLEVLFTSLLQEEGPLVMGVRPVWSTILSRVNKNPLEGVVIGIPVAELTETSASFFSLLIRGSVLGRTLEPADDTGSFGPPHGLCEFSDFTFTGGWEESTLHNGWWACSTNSSWSFCCCKVWISASIDSLSFSSFSVSWKIIRYQDYCMSLFFKVHMLTTNQVWYFSLIKKICYINSLQW